MSDFYSNLSNEPMFQIIEFDEEVLFPSPVTQDVQTEDAIIRVVGNKEYRRPKDEHLHEFIHSYLAWTLGNMWIGKQQQLRFEQRHKIMQWSKAMADFSKRMAAGPDGKMVFPSGEVKELMSLAADVYYLKLIGDIPKSVYDRLKNQNEFQGARYEIAVAAALVRAGFEIEWSTLAKDQKKPEFDAIHKFTSERIAIEVKKRPREEVIENESLNNDFVKNGGTKLDIFRLYNDAMEHNPKDKPFGVFIDINLPHYRSGHKWFWKKAFFEKYQLEKSAIFGRPAPSFLAITNSAWHYEKSNRAGKGEGLLIGTKSSITDFPLKNHITLLAVKKALNRFGKLPEDKFFNCIESDYFDKQAASEN